LAAREHVFDNRQPHLVRPAQSFIIPAPSFALLRVKHPASATQIVHFQINIMLKRFFPLLVVCSIIVLVSRWDTAQAQRLAAAFSQTFLQDTIAAQANKGDALPDFDIRADLNRSLAEPLPERAAAASIKAGTKSGAAARVTQTTEPRTSRFRQTHPHAQMQFGTLTNAPSRLWSYAGSLNELSQATAQTDRATLTRRFLKDNYELFQLSTAETDALSVARRVQDQHNGAAHVTLAQTHAGIEVFQAEFSAHFDRTGALLAASGELIPGLAQKVNRVQPRLTATEALRLAAEHSGLSGLGIIELKQAAEGSNARQLLRNPEAFEREVEAKLVYFPLSVAEVRLAWQMTLWQRETPDVYLLLLDAERGSLLYRYNLTWYEQNQSVARGLVFITDSPRPDSPQQNLNPPVVGRLELPFQAAPFNGRTLFAANDPHLDWWAGAGATGLVSNNTDTHLDRDNNNAADTPRLTASDGNFSFPLDLSQSPTSADNQRAALANLFYWTNRFHDIMYSFGFTEAAGNFQTNNFSLGGRGGDPIQAQAQDGGGLNNANFASGADGTTARVQMYLFSGNPQLDGSFDQGIILHELAHGLSTRLVGNGSGLTDAHGRGMGEGWSDYFGIVLLRDANDNVDGSYAVGQYAINNYARGIRRYPYSTDKRVFPLTLGDIKLSTEVHNVGEIWCNALLEMRALLIRQLGFQEGQRQAIQLVVDGLKLTPLSPSFLDARNAILLADKLNNGGANQCLLWQAFSKRGMGWSARALNARDARPEEAFDSPPSCSPAGTLSLDRRAYLSGENLNIMLGDRNAAAPVRVRVESSVTGDQETITLNADGTLVGLFTASVRVASGAVQRGDGVLQATLVARDKLRVIYADADNGNGTQTQVTAQADLAGEKTVFEDTVEGANPGWQVIGVAAGATGAWGVTTARFASGAQSWTDSPGGSYQNNLDTSLVSPLFDFSNAAGVTLTFAHSYNFETGFDFGLVEFSLDDGASWQRVAAFTGALNNFAQTRVSLDKLAGIQRARLRFRVLTDAGVTADGWYVDDVRLIVRAADATAALTPIIADITPAFGLPNGGTAVKLSGINFTESSDTRVFFDNAPATSVSVLGNTVLTAIAPAHPLGAATVRVENRYGAAVLVNGFTYYTRPTSLPQPKVTSLFPSSGSLRGGTTVTITGSDFTPEATVSFGTQVARSVTFVSANVLRAVTPASQVSGANAVDLSVGNPTTARTTLTNAFNYIAPTAPTARVLVPNGGERFFTGNTITLRWQSSDNRLVANHRLELQRSVGPTTPAFQKVADIALNLPGAAQSFNWTIPSTLTPSALYRLRVIAVDDEGTEGDAYSSGDFAIERRWLTAQQMPQALQRLAVVNDGRYIYAIGGRGTATSSTTVNTVRRLDPTAATPTWETLASLPRGLNATEAVYLNGKIYVPGGINSNALVEQQHFVYDIASNTWSTAATPPSDLFLYAVVSDEARGVYYQIGGLTNAQEVVNELRAYDPRTNSWHGLPPMKTGRFAHEAALFNGKLYVVGGADVTATLADGEVFDFASQTWTSIAPLTRPRRYAINGLGTDNSGHPLWFVAAGEEATGLPPLATVEAYDFTSNRWLALDNSFNLLTARTALGGTTLNGVLYALGGGSASSGTTTNTQANESLRLSNVALQVTNQPPLLTVPASQLAFVNAELKLTVTANDFGANAPLTLTAQDLPAGARFEVSNNGDNQARGLLRWTPQANEAGRTFPINFTVSDGQLSDVKTVAVRVVTAASLAIVSAADYRGGQFAPDSIVTAFGTNLASSLEAAQSLPLPVVLAGTMVTVNGVPAPLFFVSPTQINFLLPPAVELGAAQIVVSNAAGSYALGTVEIVAAQPSLFTANASGQGDAAALATADGVNFQTPPFDVLVNNRPNILLLFGTGLRRALADNPADANGVAEAVGVTIEGQTARVLYAGAQGRLAGLDQLNIELPASLAGKGARRVEVLVMVNGVVANRVMVQLK
jgi:uncharacterized protein (TIGR03437 family)